MTATSKDEVVVGRGWRGRRRAGRQKKQHAGKTYMRKGERKGGERERKREKKKKDEEEEEEEENTADTSLAQWVTLLISHVPVCLRRLF